MDSASVTDCDLNTTDVYELVDNTNKKLTICDCKPLLIYNPIDDKCYRAYTQGPCLENELFVPGSNGGNSTCISNNPCESGKVKFENECFALFPLCAANNSTSSPREAQTGGSGSFLAVEVQVSDLSLKKRKCNKGNRHFIGARKKIGEDISACPERGSKRQALSICSRSL